MNKTKLWNHQKPSNTRLILITQLEVHSFTATGKWPSANEIAQNLMNIHDVIIILVVIVAYMFK